MVGLAGFEPTTSAPPVQRATKLRHSPMPIMQTILRIGSSNCISALRLEQKLPHDCGTPHSRAIGTDDHEMIGLSMLLHMRPR